MEIIKECFDEHALAFTVRLQSIGLTAYQAREFLPIAASCVLQSQNPPEVRQAITDLISPHPALILTSINLTSFANKLGVSPRIAKSGLDAIYPILSTILRRKKDGIVNTVISLGWNDQGRMNDAAKQIFH